MQIAAVLLVDNGKDTKFLFLLKKFHLKENRYNQSYNRYLCLQETKTRINSYI